MPIARQTRFRLGCLAAAAAPVLTVQAVRWFADAGPATAQAAAPAPAVASPSVALVERPLVLGPEQQAAMAWLKERSRLAGVGAGARSPMYELSRATPSPRAAAAPDPVAPEPAAIPVLRLGGVASRGDDAVASINSRLLMVGDQPATGWTIVRIDQPARTVILEGVDGRKLRLTSAGLSELDCD